MPFVPLNYRLTDEELERLTSQISPAVLVTDAERASSLKGLDGIEVLEREEGQEQLGVVAGVRGRAQAHDQRRVGRAERVRHDDARRAAARRREVAPSLRFVQVQVVQDGLAAVEVDLHDARAVGALGPAVVLKQQQLQLVYAAHAQPGHF